MKLKAVKMAEAEKKLTQNSIKASSVYGMNTNLQSNTVLQNTMKEMQLNSTISYMENNENVNGSRWQREKFTSLNLRKRIEYFSYLIAIT